MPAALAIPLITAGVSAASGLIGSHAAKAAAKTQQLAGQQAIGTGPTGGGGDPMAGTPGYAQQYGTGLTGIYNQQMAGMQPYANMGQAILPQLMQRWHDSPYNQGQSFGMGGPTPPSGPPQGQPQQPQGGGSVMLRAPDGSMQAVPQALAAQFIAKGAVPMQGGNYAGTGSTRDSALGMALAPQGARY